jgi:hypothetical protein
MTLLSEAAYADLFLWVYVNERGHQETEAERAKRQFLRTGAPALAFPPMLRTDTFSGVARSIAYMETHAGRGDTFVRKIEDIGRCHGSAMAQVPLQLGVYGPVIAHEYGHIEQNACPSGAVPVPADAQKEIARYREIACSTASSAELLADLRSIELLRESATRMQLDLATLGLDRLEHCAPDRDPVPISSDLDDRIDWRLRSEYYTLYATGLFVGTEYRTIVGKDTARALSVLGGEPQLKDSVDGYARSLKSYFQGVGFEQQRGSPASADLLRHMSEPYRVSLALSKDPQVLIARTFPVEKLIPGSGLFFYPGLRMAGLLQGHIEGLHAASCPNTGGVAESKRLASEVVRRTFPLPER